MTEKSSHENPILSLWKRGYPFDYWDNRITKINPHNPQDRLETLVTLLKITDLYTHIFVSNVKNPNQPWFMVKEGAMPYDLKNTLDKLTKPGKFGDLVHVETLTENPEGLISYEKVDEDWNVSQREWIAIDLLGCPAEFDEENKQVNPLDNPDVHYGAANSILNFWRENKPLLNDFKHGFRILPFDTYLLDWMLKEGFEAEDEEALNSLRDELEAAEEEWALYFLRMSTEEAQADTDYDYEVSLNLHRVHLDAAMLMCRICLNQLFNLFGRGGSERIESEVADLLALSEDGGEDGVIEVIEHRAEFAVSYSPSNQ